MCTDRRDFLRLSVGIAGATLLAGKSAFADTGDIDTIQQRQDVPELIQKLKRMTAGVVPITAEDYIVPEAGVDDKVALWMHYQGRGGRERTLVPELPTLDGEGRPRFVSPGGQLIKGHVRWRIGLRKRFAPRWRHR